MWHPWFSVPRDGTWIMALQKGLLGSFTARFRTDEERGAWWEGLDGICLCFDDEFDDDNECDYAAWQALPADLIPAVERSYKKHATDD